MRNKYLLLVLFVCLKLICYSQEVDQLTAIKVSKNYFKKTFENGVNINGTNKYIDTDSLDVISSYLKMYNGHKSYYITNFKGGGWVITSSHKAVGPILAYSEKDSIKENGMHCSAFLDWMKQYDIKIDSAYITNKKTDKWSEIVNANNSNKTKSYNGTDGFYLLDSKWGQAEPNIGSSYTPAYNSLMDGNCFQIPSNYTGKYLAGCSPVAIGQIMKYWEYSSGDYADFNWWNIKETLNTNSSNFNTESQSTSYLLKQIGITIGANYYCDGTVALPLFNARNTFAEYGYVNSDMNHNLKALYSHIIWIIMLKTELNNNRPIQYNSINHSFVCDGYKYNSNEFHFNFGWNGDSDGWYNFDEIPTDGLSSFHECLTGIHPNWQTLINLTNQFLSGPINKTYQAKEIIAGGDLNHEYSIGPFAKCSFIASQDIILKPGFWAMAGSTLLVKPFANSKGTLKSDISNESESEISQMEDYQTPINSEMIVSPNPSKSGIFFIKPNFESILNEYTLLDIKGNTIVHEKAVNSKTITINIQNYSKGIYFLRINNNTSTYNFKLIYQ